VGLTEDSPWGVTGRLAGNGSENTFCKRLPASQQNPGLALDQRTTTLRILSRL
jgi:hypothetical protein